VKISPYNPTNTNFDALPKAAGDTKTQNLPYLGSPGFKYTRYARTSFKTLSSWIIDFRAGNTTLVATYDGIITQLARPVGDGNYVDYVRGYLYIPVAGSYTFSGVADDQIAVYMSNVTNNANPANMKNIIYQDTWNGAPNDPYRMINMQTTKTLNLSKGYYYTEIVGVDTGSVNYYYFSMSTPPLFGNKLPANPTWQTDRVKIAPANIQP
jgi:hypothetical protein